MEKKILWEKEDIKVGELTFEKGKIIKTKRFVEFDRRIVLIVPIEGKFVYLLKGYRPLLKKTVWRVPAGTLNQDEKPLDGAKRELSEETGLKADKITLLKYYEYMGWVKFPIFILKATGLKKSKQKLEFYEKIELVKVPKEKAIKIALNEMEEPHHAFALLKALES